MGNPEHIDEEPLKEIDASSDHDNKAEKDDIFSAVTNTRRRYILHYLKQQGQPVSVGEVAEQVAAWENNKSVDAVTSKERKRVYVSLYQSHLEAMAASGQVEFDEEAGTVSLGADLQDTDMFLEIVSKADIPWSHFFLGLAGINGLLLFLVAVDVYPFTMVTPLQLTGMILVQFAAAAIVRARWNRNMRIGDPGPPPEVEY